MKTGYKKTENSKQKKKNFSASFYEFYFVHKALFITLFEPVMHTTIELRAFKYEISFIATKVCSY